MGPLENASDNVHGERTWYQVASNGKSSSFRGMKPANVFGKDIFLHTCGAVVGKRRGAQYRVSEVPGVTEPLAG